MLGILQTFLLAMTPVGELRLSIPVGINFYHLEQSVVYLISVLGNLVPAFFILLLFKPVSNFLSDKFKIFRLFFNWLFEKTKEKADSKIAKYGYFALIGFVAIPLPVTGAWTGSLVAVLFGIPIRKAFPLIGFGVMMAGVIVLIATNAGIAIEKYFGAQALLGVIFTAALFWILFRKKINNLKT